MDTAFVSRLQFGLTLAFQYLLVPLTIGLGVMLVLMEGIYLRSRNPIYRNLTGFDHVGIYRLFRGRCTSTR
jgi:cytochrome bd ubiquinol oxidase subunit I